LSEFGATTFRETFERENTPQDMARYLSEAFTPERQAAEIIDPSGTVLVAEHQGPSGDELVGYAHLVSGPPPTVVRGPAPLELKRLYVARAWHGHGVAQALMDAALTAARAHGAQTLWLGCVGAERACGGVLPQVRVHARGRAHVRTRDRPADGLGSRAAAQRRTASEPTSCGVVRVGTIRTIAAGRSCSEGTRWNCRRTGCEEPQAARTSADGRRRSFVRVSSLTPSGW
jgi:GNAT superfamily N-acetyltransferase